eukprot:1323394-Amphidinium_carterae.1
MAPLFPCSEEHTRSDPLCKFQPSDLMILHLVPIPGKNATTDSKDTFGPSGMVWFQLNVSVTCVSAVCTPGSIHSARPRACRLEYATKHTPTTSLPPIRAPATHMNGAPYRQAARLTS